MSYKPPRPFELGSDEHQYELNKCESPKWRAAYGVGICLRFGRCASYPKLCVKCFKFGQFKEKRMKCR